MCPTHRWDEPPSMGSRKMESAPKSKRASRCVRIWKAVLAKGLDSNTAFEILSIDIADVDVGDNIGAKLQSEQADADKRIAQAKAEVRRAAAVAVEQEMRAKTQ